jgi:uncharacterized protein YabN with tetrapyrrole methylase and pyrophosphatase domain
MRGHRFLSRLVRTLHRPLSRGAILDELARSFKTLVQHSSGPSHPSPAALLGKTLLLLVALGLQAEIRTEEALDQTLGRFRLWLEGMEARLKADGRSWEDLSEAEEDSLWRSL